MSGLRKPTNTGRDFYVIRTVQAVKIYTSNKKRTKQKNMTNLTLLHVSAPERHPQGRLSGLRNTIPPLHLSKYRPHWTD